MLFACSLFDKLDVTYKMHSSVYPSMYPTIPDP